MMSTTCVIVPHHGTRADRTSLHIKTPRSTRLARHASERRPFAGAAPYLTTRDTPSRHTRQCDQAPHSVTGSLLVLVCYRLCRKQFTSPAQLREHVKGQAHKDVLARRMASQGKTLPAGSAAQPSRRSAARTQGHSWGHGKTHAQGDRSWHMNTHKRRRENHGGGDDGEMDQHHHRPQRRRRDDEGGGDGGERRGPWRGGKVKGLKTQNGSRHGQGQGELKGSGRRRGGKDGDGNGNGPGVRRKGGKSPTSRQQHHHGHDGGSWQRAGT